MFGEIGDFSSKTMFDSRRYGNLYFDGKDHGIEFFAFLHTDAYNYAAFRPNVKEKDRQAYLNGLFAVATHKRDIGITVEDHLVLLATCSSSSTNGRDILVGRVTDELYEDTFINTETNGGRVSLSVDSLKKIPLWLLILISVVLLTASILAIDHKRKQPEEEQKRGREQ